MVVYGGTGASKREEIPLKLRYPLNRDGRSRLF